MTRIDNSIRNMKFSLVGQMLRMVLTFATRAVFVATLSENLVGVNGLFGSLINMLNLAELGVGASIIYSLYKPLAEKDEAKISALMKLFKKTYQIIGLIVAGLGVLLMPFIQFLIDDFHNIPNGYLIYILFLLNSVFSYFFVYKQSLLSADQNEYVNTSVQTLMIIIMNIFQMVFLWLTHNFIVFLLIQILSTLMTNIILARKVDKLYPYINNQNVPKLAEEDTNAIKRNVKAMMMHRIGGVMVNGTDNILISMILINGINTVGFFSNYMLVVNALIMLYAQINNSIAASIGNLGVTTEIKQVKDNFNIVNFLGFWIYGFSIICLYILFNPFIELWVGANNLLPQSVVILIIINFYLRGMRQATLTYRDSLGLFWYDRHKPMIEAGINLVSSWILGTHFGLLGILLGTVVSTLVTSFWIEPFVLYKYGFKMPVRDFFIRYSIYTLITITSLIVTRFAVSYLTINGILGFLLLGIVTVVLSNVIIILLVHRTKEFKVLYRVIKVRILKIA